jgi:hypothetical protein
MSIRRSGGLFAASALVSGILVAGAGTGAMATVKPNIASCPPRWEVDIITNYGHVFKPKWTGPGIDNKTSIQQGPETFTSTFSGTVTSTVSVSLGGSLGDDIAKISLDLGISQATAQTLTVTTSGSFYAPAHTFLHVQYGETQYHTYDERYYIQSNCTITNATYGDIYSDWTKNWYTWTTAA